MLLVLLMGHISALHAQQIAVNTDMLMDVAGVPSLGVEMTMTKKSTLNLNAFYSPKVAYQFGKAYGIQPEWRYYFSGRPMYRHFIGVGALWTNYDLTIKNRVYKGNGSGIGVTFGYVLPIGKRTSIDFHTSLGGFFYKHKEYEADVNYEEEFADENGNVPANANGSVLIPMRIGVSFTYILK